MYEYMKTIISALKVWVLEQIENAKGVGGGGVSSWNDLTDKPFYDNITIEELVSECEIEINEGQPALGQFSIEFIDGENYVVTWDGVEYECIAYIAEGPNSPSIGNGSIAGVDRSSDEPFFMTVYNGFVMVFGSENGTHTVSIAKKDGILKTIDPKYIKDMYYEDTKKIDVLSEVSFNIDEDGGYIELGKTANGQLVVGQTYFVNVNGIEYECVARQHDNAVLIGNGTIYGDGNEGNGEPFICDSYNDGNIYFNAATAGYYTVSISVVEKEINTIDPKYIKDMYYAEYNYVSTEEVTVNGTVGTWGYVKVADAIDFDFNSIKSITRYGNDGYELIDVPAYIVNDAGIDWVVTYTSEYNDYWWGAYFPTQEKADSFWRDVGDGSDNPFTEGLYMWCDIDEGEQCSIAYSFTCQQEIVHTIDPKYLPHMYGAGANIEFIIEEQTVSGFSYMQNGLYVAQNPFEFIPVEGNTYTVYWDGEEYTLDCMSFDGWPYIGNENYAKIQSGGDIPFAILHDGSNLYAVTESTNDSHSIGIAIGSVGISWNDLKDKPFRAYENILYENSALDLNDCCAEYVGFPDFIEGKVYTVEINGEIYKCTARNDGYDNIYMGNQEVSDNWTFPETIESYEPFFIANGSSSWDVIYVEDSGIYSIKIIEEKVETIDPKFIPIFNYDDSIIYSSDVYEYSTTLELDIGMLTGDYVVITDGVEHYITFIEDNSGEWSYFRGDNFYVISTKTGESSSTLYIERYCNAITVRKAYYWIDNKYLPSDIGGVKTSKTEDMTQLVGIDEKGVVYASKIFDGIILKDHATGYENILELYDGKLQIYCKCDHIEITEMPTKTEYIQGEMLDPSGMVVVAIAQDGTSKVIENYICPRIKDIVDTVEIQYVEAGITYSAQVPVSVTAFDPAVELVDFYYNDNRDGTYTITGWKQTLNGQSSTEMVVPDYSFIKL